MRENGSGDFESLFEDIWARHMEDEDFHERIDDDPREVLAEKGLELPRNIDLRVHANTADTLFVVFPPDPNGFLSDETLRAIAGGATAASLGFASSFGSLPSSVSTAGCSALAPGDRARPAGRTGERGGSAHGRRLSS